MLARQRAPRQRKDVETEQEAEESGENREENTAGRTTRDTSDENGTETKTVGGRRMRTARAAPTPSHDRHTQRNTHAQRNTCERMHTQTNRLH